MQNVELKAGKLVTFSSGEYSDYYHLGSYVALQDVPYEEIQAVADEVKRAAQIADDNDEFPDRHSMFQAALIRKGWLAVIDMDEIHIGSYGELDLS